MTDKQIIIDGVDVSGCEHYGYDICKNTCHYFGTPCEWVEVQNCKHKQLKRAEQRIVEVNKTIQAKEQECDSLKSELMQTNCYLDADRETIDKLKAENKKLKEIADEYEQRWLNSYSL